jgi:hypothetical protein
MFEATPVITFRRTRVSTFVNRRQITVPVTRRQASSMAWSPNSSKLSWRGNVAVSVACPASSNGNCGRFWIVACWRMASCAYIAMPAARTGWSHFPARAGQSARRITCASVSGFSLHANVCIPARARRQLEKLCRYAARPPVATERLSLLPDGRLLYLLKHRWRDGTTHVVFEPLELVGKLAALVPPPRFNLVRYHGILAPAARWRRDIVPKSSVVEAGDCPPHSGCATRSAKRKPPEGQGQQEPHFPSRPRNYSWAELMRRVWAVDVLECPRCFGRMRIVAAIHSAEATRRILQYLGLPSRAPPIACASPDSDSDEQVIF